MNIFNMLFLVFVAMKLMGFIDWSWWWVTSPLWGYIVTHLFIVFGIATYFEVTKPKDKKKRW